MHVYGHSLPVAGFITGIGFPGVSWTFVDIHARLWSFITSCWIYHWNRFHGLSLIFMHVYGHSLPVAGFITGIGFPGVSWTFVDIHARLWSFITSCWIYHWNRFHGLSLIFMHVYGHSLLVAGLITGIGFPGVSWTFVDIHALLWSFITSCWIYHWNRFHGLSLIFMHVYGHSLPVAGLITGIGFAGVSWSFLDIHARLRSFITSCWIYHWNRLSRGFMVFR